MNTPTLPETAMTFLAQEWQWKQWKNKVKTVLQGTGAGQATITTAPSTGWKPSVLAGLLAGIYVEWCEDPKCLDEGYAKALGRLVFNNDQRPLDLRNPWLNGFHREESQGQKYPGYIRTFNHGNSSIEALARIMEKNWSTLFAFLHSQVEARQLVGGGVAADKGLKHKQPLKKI